MLSQTASAERAAKFSLLTGPDSVIPPPEPPIISMSPASPVEARLPAVPPEPPPMTASPASPAAPGMPAAPPCNVTPGPPLLPPQADAITPAAARTAAFGSDLQSPLRAIMIRNRHIDAKIPQGAHWQRRQRRSAIKQAVRMVATAALDSRRPRAPRR